MLPLAECATLSGKTTAVSIASGDVSIGGVFLIQSAYLAPMFVLLVGAQGAAQTDGSSPQKQGAEGVFEIKKSNSARSAGGEKPASLKPTASEAALRLFVVDKTKGPAKGIVIQLISADGDTYYTQETDAQGFTEALVPIGKAYDVVYLSLGQRKVSAKVTVPNKSNYYLKLTLNYDVRLLGGEGSPPRFILKGVQFETGKATLKPASSTRLNTVVEFMKYKPSARIEISGHTDNVGNTRSNQRLSERRAKTCRDYIVSKGIERKRITTVGFGDTRPIAPNRDRRGRQLNRRIEVTEL